MLGFGFSKQGCGQISKEPVIFMNSFLGSVSYVHALFNIRIYPASLIGSLDIFCNNRKILVCNRVEFSDKNFYSFINRYRATIGPFSIN